MKICARYFLMFGLLGFITFAALTGVWQLRARALLATEGHFSIQFRSPTNAGDLREAKSKYFVSRLVYERGRLIGFLDTDANFVSLDREAPDFHRIFWYTWASFILFAVSGVGTLVGVILASFDGLEHLLVKMGNKKGKGHGAHISTTDT